MGSVLPEGNARGAGRRRAPRPLVRARPTTRRSSRSTPGPTTGCTCCATPPRTSWRRRSATLPGRRVRDRAGDRGRVLLRLRPRRPDPRDDLPKIDRRMRQIVKRNQPFVREEVSRDEALGAAGGPAVQGRDHRGLETARSAMRRSSATPSLYRTTGGPTCAWVRTCPTRAAGRLQAHDARGRVLARRRADPQLTRIYGTAWANARTTSTPTCTACRRPSAATTASSAPSSTCSRSPRRSGRAWRCSTPRAGWSAGSWRTTRAAATRRSATSSCTRRTSRSRTCSRRAGT